MGNEIIIQVKNLTKEFNGRRILNDINLTINKGEILAIVGMSGCGKSTLLKHLIGTLTPDQGEVFVFGKNIKSFNRKNKEDFRRRCSMVFQSGALFDSMSVLENVSLPLREHTTFDQKLIDEVSKNRLQLVGLSGVEHSMPAQLSGGMKKRVAFARAIVLDPEIVLYDEPTAGLDPIVGAIIDQLILDLRNKLFVTSVVVTHDMKSVIRIADRIAMLHEGQIIEIGTKEEIQSSPNPLVKQFMRGEPVGPITLNQMNQKTQNEQEGIGV